MLRVLITFSNKEAVLGEPADLPDDRATAAPRGTA